MLSTAAFAQFCSISLQFSTSCNLINSEPNSRSPSTNLTCLYTVQTGHCDPVMSGIRPGLNALVLVLLNPDTEDATFLCWTTENQANRDEIFHNPAFPL